MALRRLGTSAIDIDEVAHILDHPGEKTVRVHLRTGGVIDFYGEDAQALRELVKSLDQPLRDDLPE